MAYQRITDTLAQAHASPQAVAITDEVRRTLDLYKEGNTLRDVARLTGRSVPWVHKTIIHAMAAIPQQAANELRAQETAKLDEIEQHTLAIRERFHPKYAGQVLALMPLFNEDGSPKMKIEYTRYGEPKLDEHGEIVRVQEHAIMEDAGALMACNDLLLKVSKRRADLLGLNAPIKTAFTGPNGEQLDPNQVPIQFIVNFVKPRPYAQAEDAAIIEPAEAGREAPGEVRSERRAKSKAPRGRPRRKS